jgi:hypothetical protein
VTPIVVRRRIVREWLREPPWAVQQLHDVRDLSDPDGRLRGPGAAHGTQMRWTQGCSCDLCKAKTDAVRGNGRGEAHKRLLVEERQQLLDAISAGRPVRATRAARARIIVRAGAVVAATEPEILQSGPSLI